MAASEGRRVVVEGTPQDEGRRHLGAVDVRPSGTGQRLWCGDRLPGLVRSPLDRPGSGCERWLTRVARLLREERLDASSASVIEAVRLANALAAMRGRPLPDLSDLDEASRAVLCSGEETPMRLIRRKLVVGERLGARPGRDAVRPLAAGPQPTSKASAARARSLASDEDAGPARANGPGAQPAAAPFGSARRRLGGSDSRIGKGDIQGGVAASMEARAGCLVDRGERLGHDGRGCRDGPGRATAPAARRSSPR